MKISDIIPIQAEIFKAAHSAFGIGYKQESKKQLTQAQLFDKLFYFNRNGYKKVIWESYKAGLFAREMGD